ncbi:MAG TPA: DUF6600 domain-containing protein [Candidatus Angelobacter sp.]
MRKALLIAVLFAVTGLIAAQDGAQAQGDAPYGGSADGGRSSGSDPGVARLSLIRGDVSMQRGDSGDWVATQVNTPIVNGDTVATSDGGRAEIQLDYANVLRLASQTQVKIANLSGGNIQVQVAQGYANLSTLGGDSQVEIDTPNVSIHTARNGKYRVEVNSDSETSLIVRQGEAEISTAQGSTNVKEGEIITIRGTDDPEYKVAQAPDGDDWDQWNRDRDNSIRNAESVRRTNPYYTGAQDLDAYGQWVNVPGYGQVWQPSDQPANWAPYQAGRWVWEPYYGWTWVSYEPWGWAPYHYGRWFYYDTGWYWWPGPITPVYRPVWSPAFVSFVGFGRHVGFGFGYGTIGWFPCGPYDPFYPWWGGGFNRFGVIDIAFFNRGFGFRDHDRFRDRDDFRGRGFSNFHEAFNNPRVRAGITTVNAENFGRAGARFEHGVDEGTLRQARVAQGNLGVVPTRESLSARGFASAPAGIRAGASTHFIGRTQTTSVPSFREQTNRMQEAIRTHGGNSTFGGGASANTRFAHNETGTMARGGVTQNGAGDRHSGWSTFSGSQGQSGSNSGRYGSHTFNGSNPGNTPGSIRNDRTFSQPRNQGSENGVGRGGFSGNNSPNFPQNRNGGGAWQPPSNSRPRLDLSKPIVVPHTETNAYRGGSYNGGSYNNSGAYNRSYNNSGAYNNGSRGNGYSTYTGPSRGNSGYSGSSRAYSGYSGGSRGNSGYSGRSSYSGGRSSGGGSRGSSGGGSHSSSSHSSSHSGGHR